MQSPSRTWMFNENARNHRGVWHIIEGDLKVEVVPERKWDWDAGVYKKHSRKCSGEQRYVSLGVLGEGWNRYERYDYKWLGCDCELNTEAIELKVGTFIHRTITPEHRVVKRQPILCHQTEINGTEDAYYSDMKVPKEGRVPGGMFVEVKRLRGLNVWQGDIPPGPTCSRCIAAAERNGN